jgi:glucosamine 6-phosphate synthetase-like amidotransferase/phosphosugar isomerase protein
VGALESVVALQHPACEVSVELGHDVDRPRNLAKSVTVE